MNKCVVLVGTIPPCRAHPTRLLTLERHGYVPTLERGNDQIKGGKEARLTVVHRFTATNKTRVVVILFASAISDVKALTM